MKVLRSIMSLIDCGLFMFFSLLFCVSSQDCHIKTHSSSGEPVPDASADYVLLTSSENATHTVLKFRRKLNTCDEKFDVPITVRVKLVILSQIIQPRG
jgi:DOMON domain